jgi:ethanolamine ammonia-lyase small subunit
MNRDESGSPLARLRRFTPARIGLGRAGPAMPTREVLAFAIAHARARDAVHAALDVQLLLATLAETGITPAPPVVRSAAPDRATYLRRPDLGRSLGAGEAERITGSAEIALVLADGLSAVAVQRHAPPLVRALRLCAPERWNRASVVIALQARVALGDDVGARLGARLVVMLVGERPGLASPDSLGAYLTYAPHPGRTDAERNCISNVRPAGLAYDEAARRLNWLAEAALTRGLTGVDLQDESDRTLPGGIKDVLAPCDALPQGSLPEDERRS